MCKTVLDYTGDEPQIKDVSEHDFHEDVCIWCGLEAPGFAAYIERTSWLTVDLKSGKLTFREDKS